MIITIYSNRALKEKYFCLNRQNKCFYPAQPLWTSCKTLSCRTLIELNQTPNKIDYEYFKVKLFANPIGNNCNISNRYSYK